MYKPGGGACKDDRNKIKYNFNTVVSKIMNKITLSISPGWYRVKTSECGHWPNFRWGFQPLKAGWDLVKVCLHQVRDYVSIPLSSGVYEGP